MSKNIMLIDKNNVHNNRLQVINQYAIGQDQGAKYDNRYDVTILVNGLPLVHVELKRRGVAIREAFNQINRYQRDSFWAGCGLFEYVQIFVISNGTNTKYYSNSTRFNAIKDANSGKTKKEKTSNSFEFTSFWADANNKVIPDLIDFTKTYLPVPIDNLIYKNSFGVMSFNLDVPERNDCMMALWNENWAYAPTNESTRNLMDRYSDIEDLFPDDLKGEALPYFIYWLINKVLLLEIDTPSEDEAHTIFLTIILRA